MSLASLATTALAALLSILALLTVLALLAVLALVVIASIVVVASVIVAAASDGNLKQLVPGLWFTLDLGCVTHSHAVILGTTKNE